MTHPALSRAWSTASDLGAAALSTTTSAARTAGGAAKTLGSAARAAVVGPGPHDPPEGYQALFLCVAPEVFGQGSAVPPEASAYAAERLGREGYDPDLRNFGALRCLCAHRHGAEDDDRCAARVLSNGRAAFLRRYPSQEEGLRRLLTVALYRTGGALPAPLCTECGQADADRDATDLAAERADVAGTVDALGNVVDQLSMGWRICKVCRSVGATVGAVAAPEAEPYAENYVLTDDGEVSDVAGYHSRDPNATAKDPPVVSGELPDLGDNEVPGFAVDEDLGAAVPGDGTLRELADGWAKVIATRDASPPDCPCRERTAPLITAWQMERRSVGAHPTIAARQWENLRRAQTAQSSAALLPPEGGDFLLDVRREGEFQENPRPGAVNVPVDDLRERLGEVPRGRRVVVFCRSGVRAGRACVILRAAGFHACNGHEESCPIQDAPPAHVEEETVTVEGLEDDLGGVALWVLGAFAVGVLGTVGYAAYAAAWLRGLAERLQALGVRIVDASDPTPAGWVVVGPDDPMRERIHAAFQDEDYWKRVPSVGVKFIRPAEGATPEARAVNAALTANKAANAQVKAGTRGVGWAWGTNGSPLVVSRGVSVGDRVEWIQTGKPIACFAPPCTPGPGTVVSVRKETPGKLCGGFVVGPSGTVVSVGYGDGSTTLDWPAESLRQATTGDDVGADAGRIFAGIFTGGASEAVLAAKRAHDAHADGGGHKRREARERKVQEYAATHDGLRARARRDPALAQRHAPTASRWRTTLATYQDPDTTDDADLDVVADDLGALGVSDAQRTRVKDLRARASAHNDAVQQGRAQVGDEPELVEYARRWVALAEEVKALDAKTESTFGWVSDGDLNDAERRLNLLVNEWPAVKLRIEVRRGKKWIELAQAAVDASKAKERAGTAAGPPAGQAPTVIHPPDYIKADLPASVATTAAPPPEEKKGASSPWTWAGFGAGAVALGALALKAAVGAVVVEEEESR